MHTPVPPQERIVSMDVVRGFALLGILIINIFGFAWPYIYVEGLKWTYQDILQWVSGDPQAVVAWYDVAAESFASWLVQGKFYSLFSLLFGIGFILFMDRAVVKGVRPGRLFVRRVLILLGFGVLNAFLLWWGDILILYALCGLFLVFFHRMKPKWLLMTAGILLVVFTLLLIMSFVFSSLLEVSTDVVEQEIIESYENGFEQSIANYSEGGFLDVMKQRAMDWLMVASNLFVAPFFILPLFLLGAYAVRSGLLYRMQTDVSVRRRVWLYSLLIGGVLTAVKVLTGLGADAGTMNVFELLNLFVSTFADLGLAIFYFTSLLMLIGDGTRWWNKLLLGLQWAGRMALSNYLLQSVICCFLFYEVGLGFGGGLDWYGQLGPARLLLLALLIFTAQLLVSWLWLKRFKQGPAEWLWRKLTYQG